MAARFKVTPDASNHFAWIRTRYAVDRTFMAWLRTAAAMIGFGFTLVRFFQALSQMQSTNAPRVPQGPMIMGLALIATGIIALLLGLYDYRAVVRHLDSREFQEIADHEHHKNVATIAGVMVIVVGIFAFVSIVVRAVL
jgi:putative membrane protein